MDTVCVMIFLRQPFMDIYHRYGGVRLAASVFAMMDARKTTNVGSWNTLIAAYLQNGQALEAFQLFIQMIRRNVREPELVLEYNGKNVSTALMLSTQLLKSLLVLQKGVSNNPLTLIVKKNSVPDLTMMDLSRITRVLIHGQPDNIYDQIKDIIMEYITPEESIMLNVLLAIVDFTTCESIKMSQSVDKTGFRTLVVVTKANRSPEGGVLVTSINGRQYEGKVTMFVLVTCLVAAMGGLLFGYDLGITGGVTSMEPFLVKFFPSVYKQMKDESGHESQYCKFDNELLTLFTSSLYLAALIASFFASTTTRMLGRKASMFTGGLFFLIGALLNGFAINIEMLIIGRLLLGFGVGYCNQSVPVYLSEMAPAKIRGALNMGFQMMITIGILGANIINYFTSDLESGWRISLGIGAVPAILLCIGSFFLGDTPNSMIERGQKEGAKKMLQKIRGIDNVDEEFQDLIDASEEAKKVEHPWKNITQLRYRPQLTFCSLIPFFQQLTGINVIMFYAPVLFKTLGFGNNASLMSAVITGGVNVLATFVSIFTVDKFGRKILFLEGGVQMFICQIIVGSMIAINFGVSGEGSFTHIEANLLLFFICLYVAAFAWSWGPLGWLVPSEICSLEVRSAGQATNVAVNMLFTFAIAQIFLTMLCHLKFGLFFFFAGFVLIMTIFIVVFFPETNNVPIEEMNKVWKSHWFWTKFVSDVVVDHDHKVVA